MIGPSARVLSPWCSGNLDSLIVPALLLGIIIDLKLIQCCLFERTVKGVEYLEDHHGGLYMYSKLVGIGAGDSKGARGSHAVFHAHRID